MWSADHGTLLRVFQGHTDGVGAVTFSPDGKRIATASRDSSVRVWDVPTGVELVRLPGVEADDSDSLEWSSDGTRLILRSYWSGDKVFDSVPRRARLAERAAARESVPEGEVALLEALDSTGDLVDAGAWLSERGTLDPIVRRAALDLLLERSQFGRVGLKELKASRQRLVWMRSLLGLGTVKASIVASDLDDAAIAKLGTDEMIDRAWDLVNPENPLPREAGTALRLASEALARDGIDPRQLELGSEARVWALFWTTQFDEAMGAAREHLDSDHYPLDLVLQLEQELAKVRDPDGQSDEQVRRNEIVRLERRIAELEGDRWVQSWTAAHERRRK